MALTDSQNNVLAFLNWYLAIHGTAPSLADIQEKFSFHSTSTAHYYLRQLEKLGYIRRTPNIARGIEILKAEPDRNEVEVPLLGFVAAGKPILAELNDEWVTVPNDMISQKRTFALIARGTSMIGDGILDGDKLIVEAADTANHNEIVVALLDDGAVIKRFVKTKGQLSLTSSNPDFPPIQLHPRSNFKIQGILRGVIRYCNTFA